MPPLSLKELIALYTKTFRLDDDAIIPLLCAVIVGSKASTPPVWMYLIGPSSGGKTTLLSIFNTVPYVTLLSDITANTFLSGMTSSSGETSLLNKLGNNFVVIMKDFTTILSKSPEAKDAIVGQMREIYDGHIRKDTGNGKVIEWGKKDKPNRSVFIMAATEAVYKIQEDFADMGTRAINYVLPPQERRETTLKSLQNTAKADSAITEIQAEFKKFIVEKSGNVPTSFPDLDEELLHDIVDVADFASICRSVVLRDYRGVMSLALSAEMPMRMAKQLMAIAQLLIYVNDGPLDKKLKDAVFKCGFDSIPKQIRLVLAELAKFSRVTEDGVAQTIGYPVERAREWIETLGKFGVCYRDKVGRTDYWVMKDNYSAIVYKFLGIVRVGDILQDNENIWGEEAMKDDKLE